jgi:hypothetical protein
MIDNNKNKKVTLRPAGYLELINRYDLDIIPNWHRSLVTTHGIHQKKTVNKTVEEIFPPKYWPGNTVGDHLEFALKYDGINLAILAKIFSEIIEKELLEYIQSKYTGKHVRIIWFLFEFLTGRLLPIDDLKLGNYFDLLDPDRYYTISSPVKVPRQRIYNNLLGGSHFCPVIRRTDILSRFERKNFPERCSNLLSGYSQQLLKRALGYLYAKETRSSFEIEHIKPSPTRTDCFIALLQSAGKEDFCRKDRLIDIQNSIVDPRFKNTDYHKNQNFVGETFAWERERIHFISPRPDDLSELMEGLIYSHGLMKTGNVSPVIHAAAISYGFVFLHPFEDGNGRIHRFLIHNLLALKGFTPEGLIFPVSATMLENPGDYDSSLEEYSNKILPLIKYSIDENGNLTVFNDTAVWYQYIDMTAQAEALYSFIEVTIDKALKEELEFLASYDRTKKAIQATVDMPDKLIDLFIRFCLQNNGRLSERKYKNLFNFLTKDEIFQLERIIQSNYRL